MITDALEMVGALFGTFVLGSLFGAWVAESGRKAEAKAERAKRSSVTVVGTREWRA